MTVTTCESCGKEISGMDICDFNNHIYCRDCKKQELRNQRKAATDKKKKEESKKSEKKEKKTKAKNSDYKTLIEYICNLFQLDAPTGLMIKQIKDLKLQGATYPGIAYTIWYCMDILEYKPIEKYGIYFVKKHYDEASEYWIKQEDAKNKINEISKQEVKVKKANRMERINNSVKSSLFDLNNL